MGRKQNKHKGRHGSPVDVSSPLECGDDHGYMVPVPHSKGAVCGLLVLLVALVFGQTVTYDFVNYDDDYYVCDNPQVARGLTLEGVVWAFTSIHSNNWHPLTSLSHMLDCQLYGLGWPGGHHLTNVLLHAANAVFLFLVLDKMTGSLWCSAFAAALFAVHPLHVESVAWVAERKDVLSGLLFMLTLAAYVRYAQHPFSLLRYLLVTVLFALGLMAKPMLVTLPLVLLLLDYWPLGRVAGAWNREQGAESKEPNQSLPASFPRLVVEKLPWLALAAASCLVTYWAHTTAVVDVERLTLATRFANATVSCIAYVAGFLCPVNLAVFYPHPQHTLPIWEIAGAGLLLAGISLAVVASRRKFPYLTVGWLWFLGMLVPVIGLVQVGSQAMADRYTYLTQIGLCIAVVWAVRLLLGEGPLGIDQRITSGFVAFRSAKAATFAERKATFIDRPILGRWLCGAGGALLVAGLMACAWRQTTYWQNSETLWTHTLACTSQNSTALKSLGKFLACRGRLDEAVTRFRQALEIQPHSAEAHSDLGYALAGLGRLDEAIVEFQRALEIDADLAEAENNLGIALAGQGRLEKAVAHYRRAVEIKPDYAQGHFNLGNALAGLGRLDEAIPQFQRALEIKGDLAEARGSLGFALASCGRVDEAIDQFRQALEIRPDYADAHRGLGVALAGCGEFDEALTHFQKTLEIKPDDVVALNNVAWIRATHPDAKFRDGPGAVALAQRAVALSAGDADTLNTLAAAYAEAGRFPDAVRTAKEALRAATAQGNQGLADSLRKRIEIYGQRRPWRDSPPPGPIKGR